MRFGMGSDVLFLWLWMGLTSAVVDIGCGGLCCGVFFFFVAVADIGGQWLICGGGKWLWAVAVNL